MAEPRLNNGMAGLDNGLTTTRPRKPPPITPKRFTRFFTPRSSTGRVSKLSASKSGRQLRDITLEALNRSRGSSHKSASKKSVDFADVLKQDAGQHTPLAASSRKRKSYLTPVSSSPQSSPCKRTRRRSASIDIPSSPPASIYHDETERLDSDHHLYAEILKPRPIKRAALSSIAGRIAEREFGGYDITGRGRRKDSCIHWELQTAPFCSGPDDVHAFRQPHLPFCTASCNTNSLIACGDESGSVRLLDSDPLSKSKFAQPLLCFQPHNNAVLDLVLSSDDQYLATASGDQTSRIIDMKTQLTISVLQGHCSSVKQVRFQPGNNCVLATSSRDGDVRLWDTRCRGSEALIRETRYSVDATAAVDTVSSLHKVTYASTYVTIVGAHGGRHALADYGRVDSASAYQRDNGGKGEGFASTRSGDVSVTALAFFARGREHLLLTASESSTCVKLWDVRSRFSRRGNSMPLSTTKQPESHNRYRHFGISTLLLGCNEARLYALSRDNTVYVYPTSHLILGNAPELSASSSLKSHRYCQPGRNGVGPIYGFRHRNFHATSFYVKAAIRPARGDKSELLAVGSSDRCVVLFPTDESMLDRRSSPMEGDPDAQAQRSNPPWSPLPLSSPLLPTRPNLRRTASGLSARMTDTIPIFESGTALVHGHQKEVTSLIWTHDGSLVSVSDDYTARRWTEEEATARELRIGGEGGGQRWNRGWAEVSGGVDEEDDECE